MTAPNPARLVVLTAGGLNPQVMINALHAHFPNLTVIEESYESKTDVLKRRARRLGWLQAVGQLGTMILSRLGKRITQKRTEEIIKQYGLISQPLSTVPVTRVSSLNDPDAHAAILRAKPDLLFSISCRLLSRSTLAVVPCPIVNFHAGINPSYRGQMGGYWARVENDESNFGATLHYVDAGTDTGDTLAEVRVRPASNDTISTYPLLLTAASIDPTIQILTSVLDGTAKPYAPSGPSRLRFPPPLWTYLFNGATKSIW